MNRRILIPDHPPARFSIPWENLAFIAALAGLAWFFFWLGAQLFTWAVKQALMGV